jgi:hypothetical protein
MVNRLKNLIELLTQLTRQEITDIVDVVGPLGAWAAEISGRAKLVVHPRTLATCGWRGPGP